ncbi:hypothetical protein Patl1_32496 [Pistacia atlantica]|uniref:Uncharacterized protein n=1 Tax=Pistacia atlantica TaxID=434234 RepID=A0ACC1API5_9ROSI|nr:hypothetical protein Patl1_32496 [Pistacia atlantica]
MYVDLARITWGSEWRPLWLPSNILVNHSRLLLAWNDNPNSLLRSGMCCVPTSKTRNHAPVPNPYLASTIARIFFDNIFKLHGFPKTIVSDRDKIFLSNFWRELFRLHGTQLKFCSAYHPQTDGQSEVTNRCLENYLSTALEDLDTQLHKRTAILSLLKENLANSQNRMKVMADRNRTDKEFEHGDWVYIRLQPYRQTLVAFRKSMKLSPRYFGPYKILECIGAVAYRLDLPNEWQIHPVFHISQLKKKLGDQVVP